MITQKQMYENMDRMEGPIFPSIDEIIEYHDSGEDDRNALEYEKAYCALIEQVKDKTHEEKVSFLMKHMEELRDIVTMFSSTRDMYLYDGGDFCDEVLANLMIYRYENNISVLDDEYCILTKDFVKGVEERLREKIAEEETRKRREETKKRRQWEAEHPEVAKAIIEQKLRKNEEWAEQARKNDEELFKNFTPEDWKELIYYKSFK